MIRVEVLREDGRHKALEASFVLPGLCRHGSLRRKGALTITHVMSGLALFDEVEQTSLQFLELLDTADWRVPPEEVFSSQEHIQAAEAFMTACNNHLERSRKQEKRIAKDMGGKVVPASGAAFGLKRDVITPSFLLEAKTTGTKKYFLSFKDFTFLTKQAYQKERLPCYAVEIDGMEEVIVLDANDVDMDLLKGTKKVLVYSKGKKGVTLTRGMAVDVMGDKVITIMAPQQTLLVLSYRNFLEIAKRVVV